MSKSQNGYSWKGAFSGGVVAENPRDGSYTLQLTYGPDASGEDSHGGADLAFPIQLEEVWVEYDFYVPNNYNHRDDFPTNNNFFQLVTEPRSDPDLLIVPSAYGGLMTSPAICRQCFKRKATVD